MRNHCCIIWTGQPSKVIMHISIKEMEERVPAEHLMRVHREFIIAPERITRMNKEKDLVYFFEKQPIPIGATYLPKLLQWFDLVCGAFSRSARKRVCSALKTPR